MNARVLLLAALVLASPLLVRGQTTAVETSTGAPTTTTTAELTTAPTTAAPTTAPPPTPPACPAYPAGANGTYALNASECTALHSCAQRRCTCQYGTNAIPSTAELGKCVSNNSSPLPTATNCTQAEWCLTEFFTCVHRAAQEDGACATLAPVRSVVQALNGNRSAYDDSNLEKACRAASCNLLWATLNSCNHGSGSVQQRMCVVPLFNRVQLRLRGSWTAIVNNETAKTALIASLKADLEKLLNISGVEVTITVATSRRAAGDLIVTYTVPVSSLPTTTTFTQTLATIQAASTSTSWLNSTVAVYTTNGGTAADVTVAEVVNTTPVVSVPSTAPTTTVTGGTTAPATTANFTTGAPVGSASVVSSLSAVVIAAAAALLTIA